jgi:hypothetical protein
VIVVAVLGKQCCAGLVGVQTIATAYRMTNKPVPSKPSAFIAKLMKPLQDFLNVQGA